MSHDIRDLHRPDHDSCHPGATRGSRPLGWLWCALLPPLAMFACLVGYYHAVCDSGIGWALVALLAILVTYPLSLLLWPFASWLAWQLAGRVVTRYPGIAVAGLLLALPVVTLLAVMVTGATGATARCSLGF